MEYLPGDVDLIFSDGRKLKTYKIILYHSCPLFRDLISEYPTNLDHIDIPKEITYEFFNNFLDSKYKSLSPIDESLKTHPSYIRFSLFTGHQITHHDLEFLEICNQEDVDLCLQYMKILHLYDRDSLLTLARKIENSQLDKLQLPTDVSCSLMNVVSLETITLWYNNNPWVIYLHNYDCAIKSGPMDSSDHYKSSYTNFLYVKKQNNRCFKVLDYYNNLLTEIECDNAIVSGKNLWIDNKGVISQVSTKDFSQHINSIDIKCSNKNHTFNVSEDGKYLVTHSDRQLNLWNCEKNEIVKQIDQVFTLFEVKFSKEIMCVTYMRSVKNIILDAISGNMNNISSLNDIFKLANKVTEIYLNSSKNEQDDSLPVIEVYSLSTYECLWRGTGHSGDLSISFSGDMILMNKSVLDSRTGNKIYGITFEGSNFTFAGKDDMIYFYNDEQLLLIDPKLGFRSRKVVTGICSANVKKPDRIDSSYFRASVLFPKLFKQLIGMQ